MTKPPHPIAGLEIGTAKICIVIGQPNADGTLEILGLGQSCSRGVRKGEIVHQELTAEDVRAAVFEAEQMADVKLHRVFLSATDESICGLNQRAVVTADGEIALPDISAAVQSTIHLVRALQLAVDAVVFSGRASALALLTRAQMEQGALVIDLGSGTTQYVVYANGLLRHSGVLPLGGRQLSNAVAASLKISLNQAEQLKRRHGSAVVAAVPADSSELANSTGRFPNRIEVHQMRGIMVAQLTDIFSVIAQQLKRLGLENSLSAGVFLCGGTARTPGIIALAERELQMNTNTYCASVIDHQRTALQQPEFATAIGLVKYGVLHPRKGQD